MTNLTVLEADKIWIDDVMERFKLFNIKHHWMPNAIGMWPNECECLLWCAIHAQDGDWVEIGSFCGGSAVLLNVLGNTTGKIHCVDIEFNNVFYHNVHSTGRFYDTVLHECDSSDLRRDYDDGPVSFALIDGFHSYQQVLWDFFELEPLLVEGAIIAFHDLSPKMWDQTCRLGLQVTNPQFDREHNRTGEDFRLDEAVSYILRTRPRWEWIDIPVKNKETHFDETHLTEWVRGKTSPFTSLGAIRKTK